MRTSAFFFFFGVVQGLAIGALFVTFEANRPDAASVGAPALTIEMEALRAESLKLRSEVAALRATVTRMHCEKVSGTDTEQHKAGCISQAGPQIAAAIGAGLRKAAVESAGHSSE